MTAEPTVLVAPDADALAAAVAARFVTRLIDAQADGRVAHVVLTGGRVASAVYRAVAESAARTAIDWQRVEFWWGDERFLPDGDADRNATQAWDVLLSKVDVDPAKVHEMAADTGQGPEAAATAYAEELTAAAAASGTTGQVPAFDLLMLGVGPDGHVASLFPGFAQLTVDDTSAVAVHDSPKPPPTRVSLTFPALAKAAEIWFVVAGEDKSDAVQTALAGGDVPAATPKGRERTLWLLDEAAAAKVSR